MNGCRRIAPAAVIAALIAAALCCACAWAGADFVPTADWEPPVIDPEQAMAEAPWLLALKVAQEEVGYREETKGGFTKYGQWAGNAYTQWCTDFVTWCVNEADTRYGAGLMDRYYPRRFSSAHSVNWYTLHDRFIPGPERVPSGGERVWLIGADRYMLPHEYVPSPGDCMYISFVSIRSGSDHTTLVEGVSVEPDGSLTVHVIEGNNPDSVQRSTYPLSSTAIYGFGTPVRRANRALRLWNRGGDTAAVQRYLQQTGWLKTTRVQSQITETVVKAIKRYQKNAGLRVTGEVDLETRALMEQDPLFLQLVAEEHAQ
ncbi:MAG: peptidoglycan-binding protein [Clostridia bacterium]|nr:peptidoglycan-binding protein [Clostridia bacterium]